MIKIILFLLISVILPIILIIVSSFNRKLTANSYLLLSGLMIIFIINYSLFGNPINGIIGTASLYLFIVASTILTGTKGGLMTSLAVLPALIWSDFNTIEIFYHLSLFLFISLVSGCSNNMIKEKIKSIIKLNMELSNQIKELRVLREISAILQGTLELDKVLQIILSAVTAGYGLEFNRAILFLIDDEDESKLTGKIGIGPLDKREGLQTWQNVAKDKINLEGMIAVQEELELSDKKLNDIIQNLSFKLDKDHIASKVIKDKEPYNIKLMNPDDKFQCTLAAKLAMEAFAIVPLIVKGSAIGVLVVDNIANKREITYKSIDSLLPFANQAALAIQNAKLHKLKENMAVKDNLTGIYNQRHFQTSLEQEIENAKRTGNSLALLMMDIDYFKAYNDNNGHPAGNEALKLLSRILQDNTRENDIVCRFGGEEFAIILPNVLEDVAYTIAERIRAMVADTPFKNQETQPNGNVTISVGIGMFPEDASTDRELLNVADEALYHAKSCGRNNVKLHKNI
ncbi:hypothetical protein U472_01795 [Orenia metallireducens]|jgi:diguanylate cyclase (GGDEF)-like protein|uniref:GGDEF domain-containing protein n=1 Tax=Orenia metallireducens TaxID=1413210 RepID=A0A1C0AC56_9FIRM|nr:diguanylate cyclase [Orenia metallireducens]OCL27957.1 hypothetical protein U472_01795 [Orenia metallireducens]